MTQYLLTEEEMQAVRLDRDMLRTAVSGDRLRALVEHIACTMIETVPALDECLSRSDSYPKDRPHGCIHVRDAEGKRTVRYCDGCPVSHVCMHFKEWSK